MNSESIEKFFEKKAILNEDFVKITFKDRKSVYGIFIKGPDYSDLKNKNFWRIVPQSQMVAYKESGNGNLAKLFNGAVFAKLSTYTESFD